MPAHPLYLAALAADDTLSTVLTAYTGRTRWAMKPADYLIPEVAAALRAKLDADTTWLAFMRSDSFMRSDLGKRSAR